MQNLDFFPVQNFTVQLIDWLDCVVEETWFASFEEAANYVRSQYRNGKYKSALIFQLCGLFDYGAK